MEEIGNDYLLVLLNSYIIHREYLLDNIIILSRNGRVNYAQWV